MSNMVDVRTFGAVGDGVADDSLAVQHALDTITSTGGAVWFPPGIYNVNNLYLQRSLTQTLPTILLTGEGATLILSQLASLDNSPILRLRSGYVTVRGL